MKAKSNYCQTPTIKTEHYNKFTSQEFTQGCFQDLTYIGGFLNTRYFQKVKKMRIKRLYDTYSTFKVYFKKYNKTLSLSLLSCPKKRPKIKQPHHQISTETGKLCHWGCLVGRREILWNLMGYCSQ